MSTDNDLWGELDRLMHDYNVHSSFLFKLPTNINTIAFFRKTFLKENIKVFETLCSVECHSIDGEFKLKEPWDFFRKDKLIEWLSSYMDHKAAFNLCKLILDILECHKEIAKIEGQKTLLEFFYSTGNNHFNTIAYRC